MQAVRSRCSEDKAARRYLGDVARKAAANTGKGVLERVERDFDTNRTTSAMLCAKIAGYWRAMCRVIGRATSVILMRGCGILATIM